MAIQLTDEGRKLLKKARARILREPQKFRMDVWTCGTAHCIGGTLCLLKYPGLRRYRAITSGIFNFTHKADHFNFEDEATRLLTGSDEIIEGLWSVSEWPDQFSEQYGLARTRTQRAKVAAARIDHLLATGE